MNVNEKTHKVLDEKMSWSRLGSTMSWSHLGTDTEHLSLRISDLVSVSGLSLAFSALTPLVEHQEEHLACKELQHLIETERL